MKNGGFYVAKDRNYVYFNQNRLEGVDPKSLTTILENVAKYKNAVFAFGKEMPRYIDLKSVRVPGDGYVHDKNGLYYMYKGELIKVSAGDSSD